MSNVMGSRIKALREKLGLTQDELAEILGVNRANISNYERGTIVNIPSEKLNKMADLFHTNVDYILGRTDDPRESWMIAEESAKYDTQSKEEFDPEVRALARDIQNLEPKNRGLLKQLVDSMIQAGKEARGKK